MRTLLLAVLFATTAIPAMAGTVTVIPVPEPATLAILGAGVAGIILARRRRRK